MNKNLKKTIKKRFKKTDLTVRFGDGWINIMRPDGLHCEFYNCFGEDSQDIECYITSTYTIDDKETELDFHVPNELNEFVNVCLKILE